MNTVQGKSKKTITERASLSGSRNENVFIVNQTIARIKDGLELEELTWRLARAGADAMAQVLTIKDTGMRVSRFPVVQLSLKVTPPVGEDFETTGRSLITGIAIPKVGERLHIRFNPYNPSQIHVYK